MIEITTENEQDIHIIQVKGDVDASSSIHLDHAISEAVSETHRFILVDCQELHYISSAGLGVFMSYIEEFKAKNIRLVIFGLSKKVYNVFQILGLDQLLNITDTKESAKALVHEV
jgi:anti-sigma B factor antagonist